MFVRASGIRPALTPLTHQLVASGVMLTLLWAVVSGGCAVSIVDRQVTTPERIDELNTGAKYLKVHMLDGRVYVLEHWSVDSSAVVVVGDGVELDARRDTLAAGPFTIPLDSITILETNVSRPSAAIAALTLITAGSVALTIYCLTNTKACFGSCPTFYVTDGEHELLQAEGFSSSVAPSLEATDIDVLYRARPAKPDLQITMKNEALETHVVRYADVLAVRRAPGGRVFVTTAGVFRRARNITMPSLAVGPEGVCTDSLLNFDGAARVSEADSTYLATKETVELAFDDVPAGNLGLVVASRQSLMSTYLFYQSLAYMGSTMSEWFAWLERSGAPRESGIGSIGRQLGWIDILVENEDGEWEDIGHVGEVGPLATNVHVIPLPNIGQGAQHIRLRMTRGLWRLDWVALATLDEAVEPVRIRPSAVTRDGTEDTSAWARLLDPTQQLCTFPGDVYILRYGLPADYDDYELFLESRGYYLEWMRDEWLAEEDPARALLMFANPDLALQRLAPQFKRVEPDLEETFWNSRYAR